MTGKRRLHGASRTPRIVPMETSGTIPTAAELSAQYSSEGAAAFGQRVHELFAKVEALAQLVELHRSQVQVEIELAQNQLQALASIVEAQGGKLATVEDKANNRMQLIEDKQEMIAAQVARLTDGGGLLSLDFEAIRSLVAAASGGLAQ
jgi:outer membrane murein-binding lipoprotein Lpp